jgi:glycosyltransferase involved in cell wall biosynthesis
LHSPGFTVPFLMQAPRVFTVHDLKVYALPHLYPIGRRVLRKFLLRESIRSASAVIAVSNFTRNEIVKRIGLHESSIYMIHNAAESQLANEAGWRELAQRLGIRRDYVVVFSSRECHKNVAVLLRAFALSRRLDQTQLVVVGHLPEARVSLPHLANDLGIRAQVVFTGYLSEPERRMVLRHAQILAFPSLYEGFGIVLLDAMLASVPIACANVAALPEVAGPAALFFDPLSVNDVTAVLERLTADRSLRERLVTAGRVRACDFSWEESARQTLRVYERVGHKFEKAG